jgi:hypothetical protein
MAMSWVQTLVTNWLPAEWAAAMEAESRAWRMRCPCGREISVWDAGGIRYKAAGNPKRRFPCPHCGPTWHTVYKKTVEHSVGGLGP